MDPLMQSVPCFWFWLGRRGHTAGAASTRLPNLYGKRICIAFADLVFCLVYFEFVSKWLKKDLNAGCLLEDPLNEREWCLGIQRPRQQHKALISFHFSIQLLPNGNVKQRNKTVLCVCAKNKIKRYSSLMLSSPLIHRHHFIGHKYSTRTLLSTQFPNLFYNHSIRGILDPDACRSVCFAP